MQAPESILRAPVEWNSFRLSASTHKQLLCRNDFPRDHERAKKLSFADFSTLIVVRDSSAMYQVGIPTLLISVECRGAYRIRE